MRRKSFSLNLWRNPFQSQSWSSALVLFFFFGFFQSACIGPREPQLQNLDRVRNPVPRAAVSVQINEYCPAQGRTFRNLFVKNLSTHIVAGELLRDSDHDGIPDRLEEEKALLLDLHPARSDTNGDGFGDLLMYLSGILKEEQHLLRCNDTLSSDGMGLQINEGGFSQFIGLRNCEKKFLRLNQENFDTDGDGVPDYLELRCGMNPGDPHDALLDPDGDGLSNLQECKISTPGNENNNQPAIKQFEYAYSVEIEANTGCHRLGVENITISAQGTDLLALYLIEDDALEISHLYTAFILIEPDFAGKEIEIDFGPSPAGRFVEAR